MRQLMLVAVVAVPLGAAVVPAPAEAQVVGAAQWLNLLFGMRGGNGGRPVALEVHGILDVNPRPPPALAAPGWWLRPGGEVRAFLGMPGGGAEVSANLGWLISDPSRKGTLRPGLGLSYNLPTGAGGSIYGMVTAGLWMNMDGQGDAWGPSVAAETRLAFGGRFPVTPILSMVTEFNITTLAVGGGQFEPFVGIRLGWAIAPPDPKREAALQRRRARQERRRGAGEIAPSSGATAGAAPSSAAARAPAPPTAVPPPASPPVPVDPGPPDDSQLSPPPPPPPID